MFYNMSNFIVRLLTFIPVVIIIFGQMGNIYAHRKSNGLNSFRRVLFFFSTAIFIEYFVRLIGDFHYLIFGIKVQNWLGETKYILLFSRVIILIAVWCFLKVASRKDDE